MELISQAMKPVCAMSPGLSKVRLPTFMMALRQWFKDPLADQRARTRIRTIKQRRHFIAAYIQEFQGLASQLIDWPQEMLIEYFREALNCEVFYTCLS